MSTERPGSTDRTAIELIEEAIGHLRTVPGTIVLRYYIGAIPFVLGFLYYWSDMSRSAFADEIAVEGAALLAIGFVWMRCWQARYCAGLRAAIRGVAEPPLSRGAIGRLICNQSLLHATSIVVVPVAAFLVLPAMRSVAFYQNTVADRAADAERLRTLVGRAGRYAGHDPRQNLMVLLILGGFGLVVMINLMLALFFLPNLIRSLTGIQTVAFNNAALMLNTTFLAASLGLTYLCVDPLLKAVYTLRCFYAESATTGEDLRVALRSATGRRVAAAATVVAVLAIAGPAFAQPEAPTPPPVAEAAAGDASVSPDALDRAIRETLAKREYAWRLSRESDELDEDQNFVAAFFQRASDALTDGLEAIKGWLDDMLRADARHVRSTGRGFQASASLVFKIILVLLVLLLVAGVGWVIYRIIRMHTGGTDDAAAATPTAPVTPDLHREDVTADQLPEDDWRLLSADLLDEGKPRLALRAIFLAMLAGLGDRGMIQIARFKSNAEYERELTLRAGQVGPLPDIFSDSRALFEQVWYGDHAATAEQVDRLRDHDQTIKRELHA